VANGVVLNTKIDNSGVEKGFKEAESIISKSLSDIDKKIEAFKKRLIEGSVDKTFVEKEAEGIKKAISGLEKQADALMKLQGLDSLKKELSGVIAELDKLEKRGVNSESVAKAYNLDGKIKELSAARDAARDAVEKFINSEGSVIKQFQSERDAISKRLLSDSDKSELKENLQVLEKELDLAYKETDSTERRVALEKELEDLNNKRVEARQKEMDAAAQRHTASRLMEFPKNQKDPERMADLQSQLDKANSDFKIASDELDKYDAAAEEVVAELNRLGDAESSAGSVQELVSLYERLINLSEEFISGWQDGIFDGLPNLSDDVRQGCDDLAKAADLLGDSDFVDEFDDSVADLREVFSGVLPDNLPDNFFEIKAEAEDIRNILSQGEADEGYLGELDSTIDASIGKLEELKKKQLDYEKELSVARRDRARVKVSKADAFDYNNLTDLRDLYQRQVKEGEQTYKILENAAKAASSDVSAQVKADAEATRNNIIASLQGCLDVIEKQLSRPMMDINIEQVREKFDEVTKAYDDLSENSDNVDLDWLDLMGEKLYSLRGVFKSVLPDIAAQYKELEKKSPNVDDFMNDKGAPSASSEERTSIIDVKSLQEVIDKKRELADEQWKYIESLKDQRDLMEDEAFKKGDFSGDTYRLLETYIAQASDKLHEMESEVDRLIANTGTFRNSLHALGETKGVKELEESLSSLLRSYGHFEEIEPAMGFDGDKPLIDYAASLHNSFETIKEAGVQVDELQFNNAIRSADELAKTLDTIPDEIGELGVGQDVLDEFAGDLEEASEEADNLSKPSRWNALYQVIGMIGERLPMIGYALGVGGRLAEKTFDIVKIGATKALSLISGEIKNLKGHLDSLGKVGLRGVKALSKGFLNVSKSLLGINLFKSIGESLGGLFNRIAKLASLAFVFRVITQGFRAIKNDIVEAFGTYLKYDSSLNSSINTLKTQFSTLKAQLASAFSPVISLIVPILSKLVGWCVSAANGVSALIAALTGRTSWKKAVVNSVGSVGDAAIGAADDLGDAADAADELKEKLGSYDKLNVIGDEDNKSKSSGSGSGGKGGSGGADKGADISYVDQTIGDGIRNLADWLKDMWEKADFTELGALVGKKLKDALDNIPWADIKQKAYNIGSSIATFLNGFFRTPGLGTTLGTTIAEFINTGLSAALGFVENFDFAAFGQFIADAINGVIDNLEFDKASSILRKGFNGLFTAIKTATDPISGIKFGTLGAKLAGFIQDATNLDWKTAEEGFRGLGRGIADFANNLITPETLGSLGSAVAGCVNTISGALGSFINTANWEQYGQSIAAFFNDLVSKVNWEQVGADFGGAIHGLLTTIKEAIANLSFTEIADAFKEFFKGVFSELTWGDVATILLSLLGFAILKGVATTLMTSLAGLGTSVVAGIVSLIVGALPVVAVVGIVAALIYMLWNSVNKAVEDLDKKDWHAIGAKIRESIIKGIDGVVNLALDFIANIKEGTKDIPVLGWIIDFIADGAELAVKVLGKLAKGDIIGAIKEWIVGGIKITAKIASKVVDAGKSAINWLRDRFTGAKEWVANIKAKMKDALEESPVFKWLYEKFMAAKEWVANIKAKMKDALEESPVFKWLYEKFMAAKEWVANIKAKIGDGMEDSAFKGFLEWLKGIADSVVSFSLSVLGSFGEGVQDFIDWAGNGLNAAREFGANIIGSVSDAITGFFSDKKEVFGDGTEVTLTANVETPGVEEGIDLAGTLQGKIQEIDKMALESIGEYTKQAQDAAKETGNWETNLGKTKESANQNALAMGGLAEKYFDLAEKTNRTAGEEEQLRAIADKLKDAYPELGDAIDENTGLLTLNRDAVLGLIESRKQEAIMDTLIDEYGKVSAAIEINKSTVSAAEASYSTFKNKLKELGWSEGTIKEFQDLGAAIKAGSTDQDTIDKYESLKKQLKELGIPQSEIDQIIEASTKMGELRKASQDMAEQKSNVENALSEVATKAAEVATNAGNAGDELNDLNGTEATVGVNANDTATPVIEGIEEQRSSLDGNDAVFDLGATDSATPVVEGVKTEQGTVASTVNTEYTATDNNTPVAEGVKTEQGTVPTTVNTEYTATDNTNGVPSEVESATNKVPDQKTVSFVEIGGTALAAIASVTIAAALALIPAEKKVTFKIDDQTAEPLSTIKTGISNVQNFTKSKLDQIRKDTQSLLSAIKTDVNNTLTNGGDNINSKITAFVTNLDKVHLKNVKQHVNDTFAAVKASTVSTLTNGSDNINAKISAFVTNLNNVHLKNVKQHINDALSTIKSNVNKALNTDSSSIKGSINTLESSIKTALSNITATFGSYFNKAKDDAVFAVSTIQNKINKLTGKTVTISVVESGLDSVNNAISSLPVSHTVTVYIDWEGATDVSLTAYLNWAKLGGVYKNGKWSDLPQKAKGGIFSSGFWRNIPAYASGTAKAHGTMFVAGEAGPEVVGHIGGRTEVLNKSQIASAIYSAVSSAMSSVLTAAANAIIQTLVNAANSVNYNLSALSNAYKQSSIYTQDLTFAIEGFRDIGAMRSFYSTSSAPTINVDRLAEEVAGRISGNFYINNKMTLDGRVVYDDMVRIDRQTVKRTGRSGFGG